MVQYNRGRVFATPKRTVNREVERKKKCLIKKSKKKNESEKRVLQEFVRREMQLCS